MTEWDGPYRVSRVETTDGPLFWIQGRTKWVCTFLSEERANEVCAYYNAFAGRDPKDCVVVERTRGPYRVGYCVNREVWCNYDLSVVTDIFLERPDQFDYIVVVEEVDEEWVDAEYGGYATDREERVITLCAALNAQRGTQ